MFVVLHPQSITNPTARYRVVDGVEWTRFTNGAQDTGYTVVGEHDDHDAARTNADELNANLAD